MANSNFLVGLGIARHALKQDLTRFFVPWIAVFTLELVLCGTHGEGLSGFWQSLWSMVAQPGNIFALPLHRTAGGALFAVGLGTMIVGQLTLWRNYSGFVLIRKDHRLVTHGIYRFTRNPMYLGAIIVFTGLPVFAASPYGLLAMSAQVPLLLFRIKLEEQLLAEHFGEQYAAYCRRTNRLIPFVY